MFVSVPVIKYLNRSFAFSVHVSSPISLVEQGHRVCVLCNLKPVAMRGIKSHAMVLAASNEDHTKVSIVLSPRRILVYIILY
jgi:tRNA-binding EMAP/Myf-like protein